MPLTITATPGELWADGSALSLARLRAGAKPTINLVGACSQAQIAQDAHHYAEDTGGVKNNYVVALIPIATAYTTGMTVKFLSTIANDSSCTLDVDGLGPKAITKQVSAALTTGDILALQVIEVVYDGTRFQMINT